MPSSRLDSQRRGGVNHYTGFNLRACDSLSDFDMKSSIKPSNCIQSNLAWLWLANLCMLKRYDECTLCLSENATKPPIRWGIQTWKRKSVILQISSMSHWRQKAHEIDMRIAHWPTFIMNIKSGLEFHGKVCIIQALDSGVHWSISGSIYLLSSQVVCPFCPIRLGLRIESGIQEPVQKSNDENHIFTFGSPD
jgi:hypothetical protein